MTSSASPTKRQRKTVPQIYRRPLPAGCIAFNSAEGRRRFSRALAAGTLEPYFRLSEQFRTQDEPAYCGISTLVMILNTLGVDPGRVWKGPWRWYHERMLDCCKSLEQAKREGITLAEFCCLARCNGCVAEATSAEPGRLPAFRKALEHACSASQVDFYDNDEGDTGSSSSSSGGRRSFLALSYNRKVLGQSGAGHFSPLAGYDAATDSVLILDVARYKYPPHWVAVETIFASMATVDSASGSLRGWIKLARSEDPSILLFRFKQHPNLMQAFRTVTETLTVRLKTRSEVKGSSSSSSSSGDAEGTPGSAPGAASRKAASLNEQCVCGPETAVEQTLQCWLAALDNASSSGSSSGSSASSGSAGLRRASQGLLTAFTRAVTEAELTPPAPIPFEEMGVLVEGVGREHLKAAEDLVAALESMELFRIIQRIMVTKGPSDEEGGGADRETQQQQQQQQQREGDGGDDVVRAGDVKVAAPAKGRPPSLSRSLSDVERSSLRKLYESPRVKGKGAVAVAASGDGMTTTTTNTAGAAAAGGSCSSCSSTSHSRRSPGQTDSSSSSSSSSSAQPGGSAPADGSGAGGLIPQDLRAEHYLTMLTLLFPHKDWSRAGALGDAMRRLTSPDAMPAVVRQEVRGLQQQLGHLTSVCASKGSFCG